MSILFPTRYVGNKSRISGWIWEKIKKIEFQNCLDAFGGMTSMSYKFKLEGKQVFFNDILHSCETMGLALIANNNIKVNDELINDVLDHTKYDDYPTIIQDNFKGIYYKDEENIWLDKTIYNIYQVKNLTKRSILLSALFQACLIKRPFNLFHRNNLYLRLNDVERTFSNHITWERSFDSCLIKFVKQINDAIIDNKKINTVTSKNVFDINIETDLVYLDPPYCKKVNGDNYLTMYHFLEGISDYWNWESKIDQKSKTKKLNSIEEISIWNHKTRIHDLFNELVAQFKDSTIALSYRSDGIPDVTEITQILYKYKKNVEVYSLPYQYALSPKKINEMLFLAY